MQSLYKKLLHRNVATVLFFLLFATAAFAQNISIQGVLREPNGRSVDDGFYSVTFKIYDTASAGTALWTDTYTSLETRHGVFSANLGDQAAPLDVLSFDKEYFVGITVENYGEMSPRIALTIYPYSKSVLGTDNQFPSVGDVTIGTANLIVSQGTITSEGSIISNTGGLTVNGDITTNTGVINLAGPSGRLIFNDGSSLNSANLGGSAASLANPTSIGINADGDGDGTGNIDFQIGGVTKASINNAGTLIANQSVEVGVGVKVGALGAAHVSYEYDKVQAMNGASTSALFLNPNGGAVNLGTGDVYATNSLVIGSLGSINTRRFNNMLNAYNVQDPSTLYLNYFGGNVSVGAGGLNVNGATHITGDITATGTFRSPNNLLAGDPAGLYISYGNGGIQSINAGAVNRLHLNPSGGDVYAGAGGFTTPGLIYSGNNITAAGTVSAGNVGIGTGITAFDQSLARLVVKGFGVNHSWALSQYMDGTQQAAYTQGQFVSGFSIHAHEGIASQIGFYVTSDERIKNIESRSNSAEDLAKLNELQITDYSFIDKVHYGNKQDKKLIAQEVRAVYPQAVSLNKNFVPTIYATATKTTYAEESGLLTVKLKEAHDLVVGDKVKLMTEEGEVVKEVVSVSNGNTFIVASEENHPELFVYGKQVDDFHQIDYDAISMLNVSATQELTKQNEKQQKEIDALKAENAKLKSRLGDLATLEAKVDILLGLDKAKNEAAKLVGQQ
ncbi:MAG: tail fiber domain-containing protein [Cyclobacteriaceae bacterium]